MCMMNMSGEVGCVGVCVFNMWKCWVACFKGGKRDRVNDYQATHGTTTKSDDRIV